MINAEFFIAFNFLFGVQIVLKYLAVDRFTILLVLMVLLASILPISGQWADGFNTLTTIAIAILFFLHGAKLSREAVIQGMMNFYCFSAIRHFIQTDFATFARRRLISWLSVYVLFAVDSTVLNCLYFGSRWQCRRGGM